jgi:hypothetical protein
MCLTEFLNEIELSEELDLTVMVACQAWKRRFSDA